MYHLASVKRHQIEMMFRISSAWAGFGPTSSGRNRGPRPRDLAVRPYLLFLLAVPVPLLVVAVPGSRAGAATAPLTRAVPAAALTTAVPAVAAFAELQGLAPKALGMALDAVSCARARGLAGRDDVLTVIDYSLPSTEPRLWVLDLARGKVLFHELVAHGAGSGDNRATRFSNDLDSRQTSLGLFLTGDTYEGGNGYSLKLHGLDAGINDRAEERKIVIHGAWYVSPEHASQYGRLGRSWGCPALPVEHARDVIDVIKGGSYVFAYAASDGVWLRQARAPRGCAAEPGLATVAKVTAAEPAATVR